MHQLKKMIGVVRKYHVPNIFFASLAIVLSFALVDRFLYLSPTKVNAGGVPSGQEVWTWGDNTYGQLGTGSSSSNSDTPVQITSLSSNVSFIATAYNTDYAVKTDGTVYAWGSNSNGELGSGSSDTSVHNTPTQVSGVNNVIAISGSITSPHVLALESDGSVWTWGKNDTGIGATDSHCSGCNATPFQISGLSDIIAVSAGYTTDYALKSDGTVYAWGYNNYGEMGNGSSDSNQHTPTQVSGLSNVKEIVANYRAVEALRADGTEYVWGDDTGNQLGGSVTSSTCGTYTCVKTPTQEPGLSDIVTIGNYYQTYGGGYVESDALLVGGNGYWWRAGSTTPGSYTATRAELFGGYYFWFARQLDGTAIANGNNPDGQLGDGNYTSSPSTPPQVGSLTNVSSMAAGQNNGIALATN